MDNTTALNLTQNFATILCLDVPKGTEFGIDHATWSVGPLFKGIKMIPPGIHYITYSAANNGQPTGMGAPTLSFFLHTSPKQIIVKRWNPRTEDFYEEKEMDKEEEERYADGVRRLDFDSGLAPYPLDRYNTWKSYSNFVTEQIMKQIQPISGCISAAAGASAEDEQGIDQQVLDFHLKNSEQRFLDKHPNQIAVTEDTEEQKKMEKLKFQQKYCPRFTHIPTRLKTKNATPQQLTQLNIDKSGLLDQLISTSYDGDQNKILGEVQSAFITFFLGHSYEGFRQWKEMLILLSGCDDAVSTRPDFFKNFIDLLHFQLQQVPEDFFTDPISGGNFLRPILKNFFEVLSEPTIERSLANKGNKFKETVQKRFQINFNVDEFDDEDAPVIVDE
eukprot:TRINITY_DN1651_c0_g1_i1.p1 TRINITY_DN1651_c0_g1~~TRINITY_DN1651_c0_g1_i1.p1  ORF type:complete len:389 (+),score=108.78 TRINITY_DN1651_c0_g1_i1:121-1287(+)